MGRPPSCCAECAAAAGARPDAPAGPSRARSGGSTRGWVGLLCVAGALLPLAAFGGDSHEPSWALGAGAREGAPVVSAGGGLTPARLGKGLAEEPAGEAAVQWRTSRAIGTPNAGRLEDGVLLPARGPGFYTYDPATQTTPGGSERQWGTHTLVREVLDLGDWWARTHPNQPRLGIGDLSRPEGGHFPGPGVGHASHQNGLDVDIRLPRRDGVEGPATAANYDRALTQQLVDRLLAQGAELILIGPSLDLSGPASIVIPWPAHDDHLHVRFPNPG